MRTPDAEVRSSGDHPDRAWLGRVRAALDWWEAQPTGTVTSSITGLGAIAAAEGRISELHGGRPVILTPSATYATLLALRILGVGRDDRVLLPEVDWPSTAAVVELLGGVPVPVAVDPATLTIDPGAAALAHRPGDKALAVSHRPGAAVEVRALRAAVRDVPILEDCAAALGDACADGAQVGTLGDLAVLSFGPGKRIDAGEGGALVLRDTTQHRAALALSAHPVRQALNGLPADARQPAVRPHPAMAVQVLHALRDGLPS